MRAEGAKVTRPSRSRRSGTRSSLIRSLDDMTRALALEETGKAERIATVRRWANEAGVYPATIGPVYRGLAEGSVAPLAVPAMNLRGLTFDLACAIWRAAIDTEAGPVIFELAPSECASGRQSYEEFGALVLAAAVREGYRGPVFLQVDHLHVDRPDPQNDAEFRGWCEQSAAAEMRQVDIDASGFDGTGAEAVQVACAAATAAAASYRSALTPGSDVVYGAEVGEIGGANTTPDDLRAFMAAYRAIPGAPPLGKISVNTGTTHGGIPDAQGRPGTMPLDLSLLAQLAGIARDDLGLPGVVQHAASTLSLAQLAELPAAGVCEVHLATGLQNLVFDHPRFDAALRDRMQAELVETVTEAEGGERAQSGSRPETDPTAAQRFYAARWTAWGQFKQELWGLPEGVRADIRAALTEWCRPVFAALRVAGRADVFASLYPEKDA